MKEHLPHQIIERYRERALSGAELLDADDHLAVCEVCQEQLRDKPHVQSAVRFVRQDLTATELTHLSYEQLTSYIEGALDETECEIVDSHLELCPQCAEELNQLRAFSRELDAGSSTDYAIVAPTSLNVKSPSVARRLRESFDRFRRLPALWLPVATASLALIVGLLLWVAALKSQNSHLQTALNGERQENEKLKQDFQAANAEVAELQNQLAQLKSTDSSIIVALNDGAGRITLDKEGKLAGVASEYEQIVKQALTTQRIGTPQMLAELIGRSGVLMGPANEGHPIALLGPIGTVVMSDRPVFRWRALDGADSYVVKIYGADFNEVEASPQLSGTVWTAMRPLKRGIAYSWQVIGRVNGKEVISPVKPAPDAKFMVLNQSKMNELIQAKSTSGKSHLTLGILYAQAGLLDEAEVEFQALLHANQQSALARKLLDKVRAKRQSS